MKKIIFSLFFIITFSLEGIAQIKNEIKIISKIDNEIITNIDIENEMNYLTAINNQLKSMERDKLKRFSLLSLQKEIIKKNELLKYYDLDQENEYLDNYIENFYKKIKINSLEEFKLYLSGYNLKYENVKKKIEIEVTWNELVYTKYKDQVNIDLEAIKKKINKKNIEINTYLLSEILFQIKNKDELEIKYREILDSINEKGFVITASIYSISDTAKYGGEIGWVNERQLSKEINAKMIKLKDGETSEPIIVPGGILLLKINDKKKENLDNDEKKELKKLADYERTKQFNQFSLIHYNKIKINSKIDEK